MIERNEYRLRLQDLAHPPAVGSELRLGVPRPDDAMALAELMIAAYRDTIDYDGQTLEDAENEVEAYLAGERGGPPLLEDSRLVRAGPLLVSACLLGQWQSRGVPMVSYVMTRPEWKGRGVARLALGAALTALRDRRESEVRAVITMGNTPSERLFASMGFRKLGSVYAGDPA